jgi:hypothetical protein
VQNWHELPVKHVIDSQQFNKQSLDVIFEEALKMEKVCKDCCAGSLPTVANSDPLMNLVVICSKAACGRI